MKFFSYICKCVALDTGMCALTSNLSSLARLEIKFYLCAEHHLLEGPPLSKEK